MPITIQIFVNGASITKKTYENDSGDSIKYCTESPKDDISGISASYDPDMTLLLHRNKTIAFCVTIQTKRVMFWHKFNSTGSKSTIGVFGQDDFTSSAAGKEVEIDFLGTKVKVVVDGV